MPALGGYDQNPINIVGPVQGWLNKRRERRNTDRAQNVEHSQSVERLAMTHQQSMEYLNQSHSNDMEKMKARAALRRGTLRDAGKIAGQLPTDSEIRVGKVSVTRRAPGQGSTKSGSHSPKNSAQHGGGAPQPQQPAAKPPDRLGRHAAGPAPAFEPMQARRPGRHSRP